MYHVTNEYRYFIVNEFDQETEVTEFTVLNYLTNTDQHSLVQATEKLKRGERVEVGKSGAYIERRFD